MTSRRSSVWWITHLPVDFWLMIQWYIPLVSNSFSILQKILRAAWTRRSLAWSPRMIQYCVIVVFYWCGSSSSIFSQFSYVMIDSVNGFFECLTLHLIYYELLILTEGEFFSSFGSRPIFRAAKTPKIPFLGLPLLPNPTESLATQAMVSVTAVLYCEIHCEFESYNSYSTIL